MELLAQGAEANVYGDATTVLKKRPVKGYRVPELDRVLRKARTRREGKVLSKLADADIPGPSLIEVDDAGMTVRMSKLQGHKLRDVFAVDLMHDAGVVVGRLHAQHIIHADLTTSNMIVDQKVHVIDFGLSFFSHKVEDKATDLLVLKHALWSAHYELADAAWDAFLEGYQSYADADAVLERFAVVEKRGRNKA